MKEKFNWNLNAQWVVVLLCAAAAKLYYSTAGVNQLRWILAPTTFLVELISGGEFQFESYAGYMSGDRTFVIAASCAGVNFLITSFLMLTLRRLWTERSRIAWRFILVAAMFAYVATVVANTVRISTALQLRRMPPAIEWLSPGQLHRVEGIIIYFGFLLVLFMVSEKMSHGTGSVQSSERQPVWASRSRRMQTRNSRDQFRRFRQYLFPLVIYYATTLGIPVANGAYRQGVDFWEHALFVLLTPLLLVLPFAMVSRTATCSPLEGKHRASALSSRPGDLGID